jgi:hypothetical protein
MFGLFKKKTEKEKLMEQYRKLQEEAFLLSKSNRMQADAKTAEAEALWQQIQLLGE